MSNRNFRRRIIYSYNNTSFLLMIAMCTVISVRFECFLVVHHNGAVHQRGYDGTWGTSGNGKL